MSNIERSQEVRSRPLPATGRLGVVTAFFTLSTLASAALTVGVVTAVLVPRLGWRITPTNSWLAIPGAALLTFGFLRTTRLLNQRRRVGAELAVACLVASLAAS